MQNKHQLELIVARQRNNHGIGFQGQLLAKLSDDMDWFKYQTNGHVCIMGYNTFKSLSKPLENRINIVIDRDQKHTRLDNISSSTKVYFVKDKETALKFADYYSNRKIFIIGGEKTYQDFLPMAKVILLTEFDSEKEADTFFEFNEDNYKPITKVKYFKKNHRNECDFSIKVLRRS